LSETVARQLLDKDLIFNYSENANLRIKGSGSKHVALTVGTTVGAVLLIFAAVVTGSYWRWSIKNLLKNILQNLQYLPRYPYQKSRKLY
jgi:hypothetical protein